MKPHTLPPAETAATLGMPAIWWPIVSVRLSANRAPMTTTLRLITSTIRWKAASVPIITPNRVKAAVTDNKVRMVRSLRRVRAAQMSGRYFTQLPWGAA